MKSYLLILASVLLGAFGQVLMKYGTMHLTSKGGSIVQVFLTYFTNLMVLGGLACYALSAVIWIFAISKVELSFAYPMVALGYIVVFVLSYFVLGESLSVLRIAGLVVIVIGVLMIAKS